MSGSGSGYLSFDGRVALVTGAGSGLGRSYALELARRGAKVVVNDYGGVSTGNRAGVAGGAAKAEAVAGEIAAAGGVAAANAGSVADFAAAAAMVAQAVERFGRLDVVVVNAGVYRDRRLEHLREEDYDVTMGVHVKGAFNVVRHAWPVMRRQGFGRIVLTSSSSAFGGKNYWLYSAAKSAMIGMVHSLRYEGRALGIRVNALMPGAATAMSMSNPLQPDRDRAAMEDRAPPELVTPAVVYLCHEDCRDSGEIVTAEVGAFGRVALVKSPQLRPPRELGGRRTPQSAEWVRDNWDAILGLDGRGEKAFASPAWKETPMGVPYGRRKGKGGGGSKL